MGRGRGAGRAERVQPESGRAGRLQDRVRRGKDRGGVHRARPDLHLGTARSAARTAAPAARTAGSTAWTAGSAAGSRLLVPYAARCLRRLQPRRPLHLPRLPRFTRRGNNNCRQDGRPLRIREVEPRNLSGVPDPPHRENRGWCRFCLVRFSRSFQRHPAISLENVEFAHFSCILAKK